MNKFSNRENLYIAERHWYITKIDLLPITNKISAISNCACGLYFILFYFILFYFILFSFKTTG
ncbi:hypothetical protein [uncultured Gammaproteobacteria bacterium]|nr:hypothetical protein [uncultured Gammaproteobacteria bacterium]